MIRRLLVCEFLHADPAAFSAASPSMRNEGRLMLSALLADANGISDLDVRVVLCPDAAADWPNADSFTLVKSSSDVPINEALTDASADCDAVLLVAPESAGCLLQLCRDLRTAGRRLLLPATECVRVCSDKLACAIALSNTGLPVVETFDSSDDTVNALPDSVVLKPRFGCGCEGIRRLQHEELRKLLQSNSNLRTGFVVQPFHEGDWLSVGMIGQGEARDPLVLPLAEQQVSWTTGGPVYSGGRIPAAVPPATRDTARDLARAVHNVLPVTDGYVGIDLLYDRDVARLTIMEVNPRLCTSYVGYRRLTDNNLLRHLLQLAGDDEIVWRNSTVEFSTAAPV